MLVSALAAMVFMPAADLLPDITIWREQLYDTRIDTTTLPGRKLLRLSTGTPNLGPGRLELRGGTIIDESHRQVNQRIYRDDGTWWERLAGVFTHHPGHGHIHFDNWCVYRLRYKLADGGVGDIINTGAKVSYCILDLTIYDRNVQGFDSNGFYRSCGATVQGITPGWADIYHKELQDQWIDITGVPDGEYWLEAQVDPFNLILEREENNNLGRVLVNTGPPPPPFRDVYEDNDSRAQVDGKPEGGVNSPNLGLVNTRREIGDLSMDDTNDWFKFRLNNTGGPGDYVQIYPAYGGYDTDMELYDSNGVRRGSSVGGDSFEQISLQGLPPGYYYARMYVYSGQVPRYTFVVEPSGNGVPSITVTEPTQQPLYVESSFEAFPVRWSASDPENDPIWVSLFLDRDRTIDKDTLALEGYRNMPAQNGGANVNTAGVPVGLWNVYAQVTDGGAQGGGWAPGTVFIYRRGDVSVDGRVDLRDLGLMKRALDTGNIPPEYQIIGDMDDDGDFDRADHDHLQDDLRRAGVRVTPR